MEKGALQTERNSKTILIVDDEPAICRALQRQLTDRGYDVLVAANAAEAREQLARGTPDLLIIDVRLPDGSGLDVCAELRRVAGREIPAIVVTAYGSLDVAARAMGAGVLEYLPKPFSLADIERAVERALGQIPSGDITVSQEGSQAIPLLGKSPIMQRLFKQIALAAGSDLPVLITGQSGTGKELVAQAIHVYSKRPGPFVPVCLPALNPNIIESELFGHVRGAFTGAVGDRSGYFEHAGNGTLFLDEVSEIPLGLQAKLLRILETRQFSPVGSVELRPVRARVVAATNRRVKTLLTRGQFRQDLYYRLAAIHIHVPSLAKRREDIPLLARYFLQSYGRQTGKQLEFASATIKELTRRSWPGNVRQLKFAVEYAAVRARQGIVLPEHLPPEEGDVGGRGRVNPRVLKRKLYVWGLELAREGGVADPAPDTGGLYERFQKEMEQAFLKGVVDGCGGNLSLAARMLGMHRATLRSRLPRKK